MNNSSNIPTILVIFGATGDLIGKKILPALFHLYRKNALPKMFRVVGFSRRSLSHDLFREHLAEKLNPHLKSAPETSEAKEFLKLFSYNEGFIEKKADYAALAKTLAEMDASWGICTNKLFYLAVPPKLYETILRRLADSGLTASCPPINPSVQESIPVDANSASYLTGWTRVIVEKPFGKNLSTARRLDTLLGTLFKEEQIYRIDHYLAKEMLQNILVFRFANNLFEHAWGSSLIEKIEIRLLEKIGVEDRGAFYDKVGALRDVGQNHLLQMLALATMEHPKIFEPAAIRSKRAELLKTLKIPSREEIQQETYRAQYKGYRQIRGVNPASKTETYFKAAARLSSPRWEGTEITLESGKRLGESRKEIILHLRHGRPCLCPKETNIHHANTIVIRLEPKEEIKISLWSKMPGYEFRTEERDLLFMLREKSARSQYTEEYEKLLLDCIAGNQTLFISTEEIRAMWRFTDPIREAWQKNLVPLKTYDPDIAGPIEDAKNICARGAREVKKEIGVIGLGKMGANVARSLIEKGWRVTGYNRSAEKIRELETEGMQGAYSIKELVSKLSKPRLVWIMLPAGEAVENMLFGRSGIGLRLERGDIVIDAGNSFYKDSVRREKLLKKSGVQFLDAGVSGGPAGARSGAAIMVGGNKKIYDYIEKLFFDLSVPGGYGHMGSAGAGHFVKMIHNGIEYGMMQAIGEGFEVLKNSTYNLDLKNVARVYSRGTVIESRLIHWLRSALDVHGENLAGVSGSVAHTGEGAWTVKTAAEKNVKVKIIEEALKFRIESEKNPSYTGKVVSALREQFGGHSVESAKIKNQKSK